MRLVITDQGNKFYGWPWSSVSVPFPGTSTEGSGTLRWSFVSGSGNASQKQLEPIPKRFLLVLLREESGWSEDSRLAVRTPLQPSMKNNERGLPLP